MASGSFKMDKEIERLEKEIEFLELSDYGSVDSESADDSSYGHLGAGVVGHRPFRPVVSVPSQRRRETDSRTESRQTPRRKMDSVLKDTELLYTIRKLELDKQIKEGRKKLAKIERKIDKSRHEKQVGLQEEKVEIKVHEEKVEKNVHEEKVEKVVNEERVEEKSRDSSMHTGQDTTVKQPQVPSVRSVPVPELHYSSIPPYPQAFSTPAEQQPLNVHPQQLFTPEVSLPVGQGFTAHPQYMHPMQSLAYPSVYQPSFGQPVPALGGLPVYTSASVPVPAQHYMPNSGNNELQHQANSDYRQIGDDLWRQLRRISIPTFHGNKKNYESWKSAFYSCVDKAPATPEYKLLQLRGSLEGEALRVIEGLGHSAAAYDTAKEILERKYGGKRRLIALRMQELDSFRQIREGHAKDLERFAEFLEIMIVNLKDANQETELGSGSLYISLQKKLNESLLAKYHRWTYEHGKVEGVLCLRDFLNQEAEFLTTATETIKGLNESSDKVGRGSFVTQHVENGPRKKPNLNCLVCDNSHGLWNCEVFKELTVPKRWDKAKELAVCFRCLNRGHQGSACSRSRVCGIDKCKSSHSRLLHEYKASIVNTGHNSSDNESDGTFVNGTEQTKPKEHREEPPMDRDPDQRSHTTTMTSAPMGNRNSIALRTVPVILKKGNKKILVNALLDDASTQTYLNAQIASELALQGQTQRVTVNVLNGQVDTFETVPVTFNLESVDGKTRVRNMGAFTVDKVTGNLEVVNWNEKGTKYQHLREISFPEIGPRPIVDMLIGADYAELHCSLQDVRGNPGEPIARLTPLGWTCIGTPHVGSGGSQTHFAQTFFVQGSGDLDHMPRRFWEIENAGLKTPITIAGEQKAQDTVNKSITFENGHYQVNQLTTKTQNWFSELEDLDMIRIPRCLQLAAEVNSVSIQTFVDASEEADGAAVYARHTYQNCDVSCRLIAAKSRVAPIAAVSIPRLELVAAVLELILTESISTVMRLELSEVVFWSDNLNVSQMDQGKIEQSTANKGVKWHFNPPLAPHFSGVHESMIKSAKRAIYVIIGNADITDEELLTAFVGAEGLVNSRPLTYQSANAQDDTPLTPNHFLHGNIGGQFAPDSVDDTQYSRGRRWRHVQEMVKHFWHRWLREWLSSLTARKKWFKPHRDIQVGDVVRIIFPDSVRGHWPIGRIVGTSPGKDGHVRVVNVQVGKQVMVRPITRICPLDCGVSDD